MDINLQTLKKYSKKLTKKVDAAISYVPLGDSAIKLYLFLCEAKRPSTSLENEKSDYEKLTRSMHDCFNSFIIFFSKNSKGISSNLIELFSKLAIYGLHIHGN